MEPDFSGWATKAGIRCTDGTTIMPNAFSKNDKKQVTLVYQHLHHGIDNVLGHVILEKRPEGVWATGYFNETPSGKTAKAAVLHGDLKFMSIWANELVRHGDNIHDGDIKEVSIVLAGANRGARIENVYLQHGDRDELIDGEMIYYTGLEIEHGDDLEHADGETLGEAFAKVPAEYQEVFYAVAAELVDAALKGQIQHSDTEEDATEDDSTDSSDDETDSDSDNPDEGDEDADAETNDAVTPDADDNIEHKDMEGQVIMTRAFDQSTAGSDTLAHSALLTKTRNELITKFSQGVKQGSTESWKSFIRHAAQEVIAHAEGDYGITNIEELFPDAKFADGAVPEWITRKMDWVDPVLNGARKLPFARIKSRSADLTHEEARAKGYIKGSMKKEQYFSIAGRETTPKTIYKKQKLDRDDIIDITDFNVVQWIWVEMRFMLREEIARAILIGDGRAIDDPDKIDETKIRPIAFDEEFYTDVLVVTDDAVGDALVDAVIGGRDTYLGNNPTAFMTRKTLNEMLLAKDTLGRRIRSSRAQLADDLEVDSIVVVPILEDVNHDDGDLLIILVNMSDYSIGTDDGGEITTFDDFDIDFNQYKYLIEGRMSGALTKHKTAQVVVRPNEDETLVPTVTAPTFVTGTGVATIPSTTGVVYKNADTDATLSSGAQSAIASGATINIEAVPATGYYFAHGSDTNWSFTRS